MTLVIRTEEACRPPKTMGKRALLSSISQVKGKEDKSTYQAHKEKEMWQRLRQSKDPYLVMLFKSSWGDEGDDIRVIQRPKRVQLEQKKEPPRPREPGSEVKGFVYPPQVKKKRHDDSKADPEKVKKDAQASTGKDPRQRQGDETGEAIEAEPELDCSLNHLHKVAHKKLRKKIQSLASGIAPKDNRTYMASLRENMQQASEDWNEGIESEYRNLDFYDRAGYLRKKEEARKEQIRLRNIARGQPWREREREDGSNSDNSLAGSDDAKPGDGLPQDRRVNRVKNHLPQCVFNPQNSHTAGLSLGYKAAFKFPRRYIRPPSRAAVEQIFSHMPPADTVGDQQSPIFLTEAPQSPAAAPGVRLPRTLASSPQPIAEAESQRTEATPPTLLMPFPYGSRGNSSGHDLRSDDVRLADAMASSMGTPDLALDLETVHNFPLCSIDDVAKFQKTQSQAGQQTSIRRTSGQGLQPLGLGDRPLSTRGPPGAYDEESRRPTGPVCECASDDDDNEKADGKVHAWRRRWHQTRARLDNELRHVLERRVDCRTAVSQSALELSGIARQASAGGQTWSRCRTILPDRLRLRPVSSLEGSQRSLALRHTPEVAQSRTPSPALGGMRIAISTDQRWMESTTPTPRVAGAPRYASSTDALQATIEDWKKSTALLAEVVDLLEEGSREIGTHQDTDGFRYDIGIMLAEGEKLAAQGAKVKGFSSALAVGAREKRHLDQVLIRMKTLVARFRKISKIYYGTEKSRQSPELLLGDPSSVPWGKSLWGCVKDSMDAQAQHAQRCATLYQRVRQHFLQSGFPSTPQQQDFCMILRQLFVDTHALDATFLYELIVQVGAPFAQRDTLKMIHHVAGELVIPQDQVAAIVKEMRHSLGASNEYMLRADSESPTASETPGRGSVACAAGLKNASEGQDSARPPPSVQE